MKIKNGDNVIIIAGKDKGKEGVVLNTNPTKGFVYIEGINIQKKHNKPSQSNQEGGIEDIEGPVHISNIMVKEGKVASRVGFIKNSQGKKIRILKKNKQELK